MICLTTGKPADGMSLVVGRIRHPASSAYMLAINELGQLLNSRRLAGGGGRVSESEAATRATARASGLQTIPVGNHGDNLTGVQNHG